MDFHIQFVYSYFYDFKVIDGRSEGVESTALDSTMECYFIVTRRHSSVIIFPILVSNSFPCLNGLGYNNSIINAEQASESINKTVTIILFCGKIMTLQRHLMLSKNKLKLVSINIRKMISHSIPN